MNITDLRPVPVRPPSAPGPDLTQEEVIIAQGSIGTIRVLGGAGGTLVRSQKIHFYGRGRNGFQVAKLRGAKVPDKEFEEIDVVDDDTTATYDALNCGETFFQARVSPPQPPQKLSNIMRLLSLVDKTTTLALPPGDYSPEPNFKTGLLSKEGTPLNPKPGRKINIFGEGESSQFVIALPEDGRCIVFLITLVDCLIAKTRAKDWLRDSEHAGATSAWEALGN